MRLKQNTTFTRTPLYIGPPAEVNTYWADFGHTSKDKAHVFASWEEGKFATSDWVNKCFSMSGFSLYEPEEVT